MAEVTATSSKFNGGDGQRLELRLGLGLEEEEVLLSTDTDLLGDVGTGSTCVARVLVPVPTKVLEAENAPV